jgi:3-oxoacyl-[acyl-carrier-protein] synthase III
VAEERAAEQRQQRPARQITVIPSRTNDLRFGAEIIGTGHYAPARILTNDDLSKMVETSDEWITARTGVKQRHLAAPHENSGTMAFEAAQLALAQAGLHPRDLDLIIVGTCSPEQLVPSTACLLQDRLGLAGKAIPAFDLAAACSGFLYSLAAAQAFLQLGNAEHVLVVGVDTLSRMTDYTERSTSVLFGDGAGAMVLRRTEPERNGLLYSRLCADGSGHALIYATGMLNPPLCTVNRPVKPSDNYIRMDGPKVYRLAVTRLHELVEDALQATGLQANQINLLIPHQANQRIIEAVVEKVKFPRDRVYLNIERFGNTSAASIPIAYDEAMRAGRLSPGDRVLMIAFGAGLTWSSALVRV